MNRKQPAVLFSRSYTNKDGKKYVVYWYYVTDEYGKRHRSGSFDHNGFDIELDYVVSGKKKTEELGDL